MATETFPPEGAILVTEARKALTSLDDESIWQQLEQLPGCRWARFILGNREDVHAPQIWIVELPPNYTVPRHYHNVHRLEIMLKGSYRLDGEERGPGAITLFPAGEMYGPVEIGSEGGITMEVFSDSSNLGAIFAEEPPTEVVANLVAMGLEVTIAKS